MTVHISRMSHCKIIHVLCNLILNVSDNEISCLELDQQFPTISTITKVVLVS